jgi:hypothetical protein
VSWRVPGAVISPQAAALLRGAVRAATSLSVALLPLVAGDKREAQAVAANDERSITLSMNP